MFSWRSISCAVLALYGLAPGTACAQSEPSKAVVISGNVLYGGAVQFDHQSGPYDLMSGRHAMGYGLSVGVRERVWSGLRHIKN